MKKIRDFLCPVTVYELHYMFKSTGSWTALSMVIEDILMTSVTMDTAVQEPV